MNGSGVGSSSVASFMMERIPKRSSLASVVGVHSPLEGTSTIFMASFPSFYVAEGGARTRIDLFRRVSVPISTLVFLWMAAIAAAVMEEEPRGDC